VRIITAVYHNTCTLIRICDELCPPSAESRFPGRPADSQLEQMSTKSHIAQWNRAPTMSRRQLLETEREKTDYTWSTHCAHLTPGCFRAKVL